MTAHFPGLVQALVDNIYKFFECCACVVGGIYTNVTSTMQHVSPFRTGFQNYL
jgi:hypothetical protein